MTALGETLAFYRSMVKYEALAPRGQPATRPGHAPNLVSCAATAGGIDPYPQPARCNGSSDPPITPSFINEEKNSVH
jgi:hypothetical protein